MVLTIRRPGADTSTLEFREEKKATVSSVSVAPTQRTSGYAPGYSNWSRLEQRSLLVPQFPAALTTRTLREVAYVTAARSAPLSNGDPSEMFTIFAPWSAAQMS